VLPDLCYRTEEKSAHTAVQVEVQQHRKNQLGHDVAVRAFSRGCLCEVQNIQFRQQGQMNRPAAEENSRWLAVLRRGLPV
jgi:hypothetical protein